MRLSVIIPAYKVEGYIEKCIRSLEDQDIPKSDYEIIVTNDGSPDKSSEIVQRLQTEFSNLILINQENQGVSMARNNAMAMAKGTYILPIDPDDYVLPNTLGNALEQATKDSLEVLFLGFETFDVNEISTWQTNYSALENQIFNGVDAYFAARGFEVRDPDRSVGMLFKNSLLQQYKIDYPKNVPYLEDGLFLSKVFAVADKVGFSNSRFYQRTTRLGSATNSRLFFSESAILGFIAAIKNLKIFAGQSQLSKEQSFLVNHVVAKFIILSLSPSMSRFKFNDYFKVIKILKQSGLGKLETQGLRFLYPKHIRMYNFSKLLFPFYFRLINK
ncbi:glycosyltransferase [Flavobacterium sp.]|uniref:glycosyltransferase family 2 protein n=1 Tax=Flavobacterium sp. TaxID=239 RepID=UPI00286CE2D3|nr:glycosyltransferase [Flavobacterium sp.]